MTIGERIKSAREKVGLSQVDLADKIQVSKQSLYKYENNIITNIPSDKIEAIAYYTNTTPAYLMGWANEKDCQIVQTDKDIVIIQRERSKMTSKEKTKLMNILKANFDEYNWEEDDSGNID